MFLAVDIGNTNIVIGFFEGTKLVKKNRFLTGLSKGQLYKNIKREIGKVSIAKKTKITSAVISSVVPIASRSILSVFKRLKIKAIMLGKDVSVPIKNLYKYPRQVGQDRLVNAYACLKIHRIPAIVVDFGTATTFDYVDAKGAYRGGLITPGAEMSIDALFNRTALLPKIKLKKPNRIIGNDTVESIRSGIFYGLALMIDGIIEKIRSNSKKRIFTIATGGLASFFAPRCKNIDKIDGDLTLKGLCLIYNKINKL